MEPPVIAADKTRGGMVMGVDEFQKIIPSRGKRTMKVTLASEKARTNP
jgi:hypothetical protein